MKWRIRFTFESQFKFMKFLKLLTLTISLSSLAAFTPVALTQPLPSPQDSQENLNQENQEINQDIQNPENQPPESTEEQEEQRLVHPVFRDDPYNLNPEVPDLEELPPPPSENDSLPTSPTNGEMDMNQ